MLTSWTTEFARRHLEFMDIPSILRYRAALMRQGRQSVSAQRIFRLRLHRPISGDIWLREVEADDDTFKEVIIDEIYSGISDGDSFKYVIDLGANIGLASRYFASKHPDCVLFAVEPDDANFALLDKNVMRLKAAGRVTVRRAAVWDRDTVLGLGAAPCGTQFNAIRVTDQFDGEAQDAIEGRAMGTLIAESGFPWVDLLKIDVEGAEERLFRGDVSWLRAVQTIAVEFHGNARRLSGFDAIVREWGFSIDDSHPHTTIARRITVRQRSGRSRNGAERRC